MNEKIKELAEQAKGQVHELYATMEEEPIGNFIDWFDTQFQKVFAELIVKECTLMLDSITVPVFEMYEDFDRGYNKGLETGKTVIKKHFGIE